MAPWRRKLLWIGLPVLAALIAANHAEQWYRSKQARERDELLGAISVRAETSALKGHSTIGIDEETTRPAGPLFLRFSVLGQWAFDPKSPTPCPAAVRGLEGREVTCIGFMYPLEAGTKLKTFCLLRTTQTCCYGPRPQYNQYLLVEMKEPVKFERLTPVIVRGQFFPDAQPAQGFIYRLEGISVTPVAGDEPDVDPARIAKDAGLPLFDFARIAAVENGTVPSLPPALLALDGTRAVVTGFLVGRRPGNPTRLLVGRDAWDGVSQGKPPTVYSAVMVFPADASEMPPVWKDRGAFAGALRVEKDPDAWSRAGIVSLHEAKRCGPGAGGPGSGPIVPLFVEIALLGALLAIAFIGKHKETSTP